MRIRWRGLELPTRVTNEQDVATNNYGRFVIEPFERGLGTTIGNSLRRVLLSSIEGSAVTSVKIAGVDHEFQSLPGVMEDVTDIVLNVKSLIVRSHSSGTRTIRISHKGKGPVTADMIEADPSIEIINRDLVIANLSDDIKFDMEMTVETGRGFLAAADMAPSNADQEIGIIYVDASYSPVTRVRYETEATRVGQKTNYDSLILEVWTDGTISPEMALVEASKILRKHLNPFVQYFDKGVELPGGGVAEKASDVDEELNRKLNMSISELELSVRASNCLESAQVRTVGQLVSMTESELLKVRSFGKTSLKEIKRKLADAVLSLGMNVTLPEPTRIDVDQMDAVSADDNGMDSFQSDQGDEMPGTIE